VNASERRLWVVEALESAAQTARQVRRPEVAERLTKAIAHAKERPFPFATYEAKLAVTSAQLLEAQLMEGRCD